MSSNRRAWEIPTRMTTASLLSEPLIITQVSRSSIATRISSLSILTIPFLSSGAPLISVSPSWSGHNGVCTTGLDGHRVIWSTSGEKSPQLTANPQPHPAVNPQPVASFLLGLQVPPINKFSEEDMEGEGDTFFEWVEQFELIANMCVRLRYFVCLLKD